MHILIPLEFFSRKRFHLVSRAGGRDFVRGAHDGAVEREDPLPLEEVVEVEEGFRGAGEAGGGFGDHGGVGAHGPHWVVEVEVGMSWKMFEAQGDLGIPSSKIYRV